MRRVSTEFRPICQHNSVLEVGCWLDSEMILLAAAFDDIYQNSRFTTIERLTRRDNVYIIQFTPMPRKSPPSQDPKIKALREERALHPHPEAVHDEAFGSHEFFDPRDLVQVKYEMLRRHRVDGKQVADVARRFGVSRQAFYKAEASFKKEGLPGLVPRRRGPRQAHKCTDEILNFAEQSAPGDGKTLREAIKERFGISIHPRSIERALGRRKKKRPTKGREG